MAETYLHRVGGKRANADADDRKSQAICLAETASTLLPSVTSGLLPGQEEGSQVADKVLLQTKTNKYKQI